MNFYEIAGRFEAIKSKTQRHSYIQIVDQNNMQIECCKEVIVMNENLIRLRLAKCTVIITGLGLSMKNYSREGVFVKGSFHSIEFEPEYERKKK